jgi:hypothetical protein
LTDPMDVCKYMSTCLGQVNSTLDRPLWIEDNTAAPSGPAPTVYRVTVIWTLTGLTHARRVHRGGSIVPEVPAILPAVSAVSTMWLEAPYGSNVLHITNGDWKQGYRGFSDPVTDSFDKSAGIWPSYETGQCRACSTNGGLGCVDGGT